MYQLMNIELTEWDSKHKFQYRTSGLENLKAWGQLRESKCPEWM